MNCAAGSDGPGIAPQAVATFTRALGPIPARVVFYAIVTTPEDQMISLIPKCLSCGDEAVDCLNERASALPGFPGLRCGALYCPNGHGVVQPAGGRCPIEALDCTAKERE